MGEGSVPARREDVPHLQTDFRLLVTNAQGSATTDREDAIPPCVGFASCLPNILSRPGVSPDALSLLAPGFCS